ncbi:Carotenoid oxygenase [Artemisia annua]|uniref:Carotenoid oxygenase n=1 Tax=Artemisia annua TaxID=35608 RepID=A0A2U1N2D6_ARTAN|nr:Carotenoid oxygenase [Artemisia annua]
MFPHICGKASITTTLFMDCLSSSFLSTFSPPNSTNSYPSSPPLPTSQPSSFRVFSVRTEDKPQTVTTTTKRPSDEQVKKSTTPSFNIEKRSRSVVVDQSLPSAFLNAFDNIINTFIDPPLRVSVDPKHVLSDNFSPVDELPPTECEVIKGTLPSCLDGAYFRNGPNPQFLPRGPYHLFDGDGMLHAIRISNGKATFCSRYVKTYKYNIEKDAGFPIIPNVFSGFNGMTASAARMAVAAGRFLAGQFDPTKGIGLANTSLAYFGNKLYALGESDLPYAVKLAPNGDIVTTGRHDFDGKLFMSMTAHPKIDPETKEAFAFRYGPMPPFLTFFRFDQNGEKQPDVPIFSMTSPSFLHDFAITKNYAIFPEIQIGMSPMEMIGGGSPVSADSGKIPRLGVIPRYMYCGVGDPMPKISGVVKLDVSLSEVDRRECIVASRMFGPGCFGGEPFFVAREPDNPEADEDDGYVISYVHNENTGESRFVVMDAKSPTLEIVAAVKLPRRVPYGFHGLFVKESDINKL